MSSATTAAVAATIRTLYGAKGAPASLGANTDATILSPPGASSPPPPVREYLTALARSAHDAAESAACGSALAGQSSESDEFSDVALWIPSETSGQEVLSAQSVLASLALDDWERLSVGKHCPNTETHY
jgi:hypothetical protein